jgi:hypothetical protein
MSIKDGKKPVSQKAAKGSFFMSDDVFGNQLAVPAEIQEELAEQGLEGRWLNAKTLHSNQGYHPKGWSVYRRKAPTVDSSAFKFGSDPDGIIRRGDLILGVKTTEKADLHRRHLSSRADRYSNINADKAQELRDLMSTSGFKKAKVYEGYDEND